MYVIWVRSGSHRMNVVSLTINSAPGQVHPLGRTGSGPLGDWNTGPTNWELGINYQLINGILIQLQIERTPTTPTAIWVQLHTLTTPTDPQGTGTNWAVWSNWVRCR